MAGVKGRSGGHNRKPTRLKLLQGNPGRRPLHPELEPQPEASMPSCPVQLGAAAKREWRRIAPELFKLGLLTELTGRRWRRTARAGAFIELQGLKRQYPEQWGRAMERAQRDALLLMHRYLIEFGMTLATRSRVRVADVKAQAEMPTEAFLSARFLRVVPPDQGSP